MEFNLVNDAFIPVLMVNGTYKKVCLRDLFLNAHKISDIRFDNPMANCVIYRFLVAMSYHMLEILNEKDWKRIFKGNKFKSNIVNEYFNKYSDRFDLFGDDPFYQDPDMEPKLDPKGNEKYGSINALGLLSNND